MFFNKVSDIWDVCEPGVPRPSLHYHAGVRVESTKPQRAHEFLRAAEFPGALLTLGADGILTSAGQLHHRGSFRYSITDLTDTYKDQKGARRLVDSLNNTFLHLFRYRCWSCVLLPGGCFPQPARWWKVA